MHSEPSAAVHDRPRTPGDLMHQLRTRGVVQIEASNRASRTAAILFLALAPLLILGGLIMAAVGVAGGRGGITMGGVALLLVGVGGVLSGLALRRRARRAPGALWTVDGRGITIDGVGPVPWFDLTPPARRMEPAPHDEGRQLALVMPLTPDGRQRALALLPTARRVLNAAVRESLVTGPQPLTSVRIPAMKEMSAEAFAEFLDRAWRQHVQGHGGRSSTGPAAGKP